MAGQFAKRSDLTSSVLAAPVSGAVLSAFYEGTTGNDTYGGGSDPDQIYGGQGDDVLSGGFGNDSLGGETGNDTVSGDEGDDTIDGGHGNDSVSGGAGNDYILGGEGADTMAGGAGNDTYFLTNAGDTVVEAADEGVDWLYTSQGIDLSAIGVDHVSLMTSIGIVVTGNGLNNVMHGNAGDDSFWGGDGHDSLHGFNGSDSLSGGAGNDWLDGYLGDDALAGGLGDDTYYVDSASDDVVEIHGEGSDTVYAGANYSLFGRAVENAILLGAGNISLTGNSLNNQLSGNTGTNALDGGAGNDWLDGGASGDIMWGRAGDDTYYVDDTSDQVEEAHGEGSDTVITWVSYSLYGRAVEIMIAAGVGNVNLTGNSLANSLTGTSGNNWIDGGAGLDTLAGGMGDDNYVVNAGGDMIVEASGQGTDTVYASAHFAIGLNVENLTLTGTANLNGSGSIGNNVLTGNAGNNQLAGGQGNDTYFIQNAGDNVIEYEGQGSDLIYASVSYSLSGRHVEELVLTGADNLSATGNSLANFLHGNDGNNVIDSGAGNDSLYGGAGSDTFLFSPNSRKDWVNDFSAAENDTINVNGYTGGVANDSLVVQNGTSVVIDFGNYNIITILNADRADVLAHMVW